MRTLSTALRFNRHPYRGLSDAGGLRGDSHAGQASGGYGGSDSSHGGSGNTAASEAAATAAAVKSAAAARATEAAAKAAADKATADRNASATATQVRALEAAATLKMQAAPHVTETTGPVTQVSTPSDRAGDVAQRAFNQAVATGTITPAGVVAYQNAQKTVTPVTLPGRILNILEKPVIGAVSVATGPFAPATGLALNALGQSAGEALNARLTDAKIQAAAAESLGPDWGGSTTTRANPSTTGPAVTSGGGGGNTTTRNGGGGSSTPIRTSNAQVEAMPSAPVASSGVLSTTAADGTTPTPTTQPAADHGGLILGAGILAAKLLL